MTVLSKMWKAKKLQKSKKSLIDNKSNITENLSETDEWVDELNSEPNKPEDLDKKIFLYIKYFHT